MKVLTLVEKRSEMKQSIRLLATRKFSDCSGKRAGGLILPAGSGLSSLTLEAPNTLLPPLCSHLRSIELRECQYKSESLVEDRGSIH